MTQPLLGDVGPLIESCPEEMTTVTERTSNRMVEGGDPEANKLD